jgi:hypothetical protein
VRVEGFVFLFVAVFLGGSDLIYWFTSHDPTGTTALALGTCMAGIICSYMLMTARRIEPRPEDRSDADIAEGAGEIGFFSPHSWMPLPLALGAVVVALGLVFAWWLFIIGVAIVVPALCGLLFEYYVVADEE